MAENKFVMNDINGLKYFTSSNLDEVGFIRHFFSTKIGGISSGEFESLNLGIFTEDSQNNILSNFKKIFSSSGMDLDKIVYLNQIHSDKFFHVTKENYMDIRGEQGDALITSARGIAIGVFTADCVPVILVDSKNKITAVVHAGWKGTYQGIVKKVLTYMIDNMGADPGSIEAAIGPSIGPCCFEVGIEVAEKFTFTHEKKGKHYVDLWRENMEQIMECGVTMDKIMTGILCTMCDKDLFFSYRRDSGKTGRMGTFLEIV
jgi:YfiH family protein